VKLESGCGPAPDNGQAFGPPLKQLTFDPFIVRGVPYGRRIRPPALVGLTKKDVLELLSPEWRFADLQTETKQAV
jgi:hypothetical protein